MSCLALLGPCLRVSCACAFPLHDTLPMLWPRLHTSGRCKRPPVRVHAATSNPQALPTRCATSSIHGALCIRWTLHGRLMYLPILSLTDLSCTRPSTQSSASFSERQPFCRAQAYSDHAALRLTPFPLRAGKLYNHGNHPPSNVAPLITCDGEGRRSGQEGRCQCDAHRNTAIHPHTNHFISFQADATDKVDRLGIHCLMVIS
jgi:hypothetical protein